MERPEVRIVAERLRLHSEEVGHATKGLVGELGRRIPDTYRNNGFRVRWSVAGWQLPDVGYGSYADTGALQDSPFSVGALFYHPPIPHAAEIGRPIPAADHPLCNRHRRRRRMHHPVPREPRARVEVLQHPRPIADDGVTVQLALLVEPRPGPVALGRLERLSGNLRLTSPDR